MPRASIRVHRAVCDAGDALCRAVEADADHAELLELAQDWRVARGDELVDDELLRAECEWLRKVGEGDPDAGESPIPLSGELRRLKRIGEGLEP